MGCLHPGAGQRRRRRRAGGAAGPEQGSPEALERARWSRGPATSVMSSLDLSSEKKHLASTFFLFSHH